MSVFLGLYRMAATAQIMKIAVEAATETRNENYRMISVYT